MQPLVKSNRHEESGERAPRVVTVTAARPRSSTGDITTRSRSWRRCLADRECTPSFYIYPVSLPLRTSRPDIPPTEHPRSTTHGDPARARGPAPRPLTGLAAPFADVEEGGGTKFDGGFTVQPKRGRAVLWPATFNDRPFIKDDRTHHEALPVLRGTKFAANFWIHQFDYVTAHHRGCTA